MLTKEQIYGGTTYQWTTDNALNTIYDSLDDFMENELANDVEVLEVFDNCCTVKCDDNRYLIKIYGDGDFCSHVAEIELLED